MPEYNSIQFNSTAEYCKVTVYRHPISVPVPYPYILIYLNLISTVISASHNVYYVTIFNENFITVLTTYMHK